MPSCSTIDAVKQKESPSDDADTSACAGDDHNIQDTPLSTNPTGKNYLYPMNSQSNLHPRAYKVLNPQFLNPMYEPAVSSAAELQADSQGDGGSNNNARLAAAEGGQTLEVTVGDDNIEPNSPDELQADNCGGIQEDDGSDNNEHAAAAESGKTVEVTVSNDNIEPDSPDELQADNCDDILPYAVFYEETDCSNNGASSTAAESGRKIDQEVGVENIEPCPDDTPSTENTHENSNNNVGQPKTTGELLTVEAEGQTEKPDNKDGQSTHTDPTPPAVSTRQNYFSDCSEIHTAKNGYGGASDGVYKIQPVGLSSPISVYCDQTTDGGGWTVIQRRFDGSVDFNRPYNAFRYGFGSANGEQWLGLENMYRLTNQHTYTLYVQLEDWNRAVKYAKYSSFSVGSSSNYRLYVSGYSGTAGDGFSSSSSSVYLSGQPFSARDVDRDAKSSGSCAGGLNLITGGWWYKNCGKSALNGPYLRPSDYTGYSGWGIAWYPFGGSYRCYLKKSKMMVRPANFRP
ncbi:PREDICTED: angiopoietin-related protein 3-like [Branchiostoma belcheri]|uniref:Angiopoietin-related protein 3-like n=1 Tax=Branchiostoma belcheri TaxID=7741 RepID=A0A6P4XLD6_BRABE|nr:PREDICTED: angiopoietin-related protein 3-like [Branchiostoma belcheri]